MFALFLLIRVLALLFPLLTALIGVFIGNIKALGSQGVWLTFSGVVVQLLAAGVLWHFATPLAGRIWHNPPASQDPHPANFPDIQAVLFSAVGLYILITAVPEFLGIVLTYRQIRTQPGGQVVDLTWHFGRVIESGLKVVLSIWLLFGSRAIVRFLQKARTVGAGR